MIAEPTMTHFVIELTVEQFRKLNAADFLEVCKWIDGCGDIPQSEVEFNGHFGPNFFFAVGGEGAAAMQEVADAVVEVLKVKLA